MTYDPQHTQPARPFPPQGYPPPPQPGQPYTYPDAPTLIPPPQHRTPAVKANKLVIALVTGAGVMVLGLGAVAAAAGNDPEPATDRPGIQQDSEVPEAPVVDEPETETAAPEPEPEPAEPDLTVAQEQAIGSAEDYLDYSGFSRQGLIGQLEFEGFSTEDAEFAVDYLDVDWNEQAVRVAESYLEYSHFSRQGLIDQLEFEGFTTEQAEHGADEVGL